MQKILILVGKSASNINSFYTKLTELIPKEYEVEKAYFEDILIDIEDKSVSITINKIDIASYDLVYFRRAGAEFLWLAATIALYLDSHNVIYHDSAYRDSGLGNKLYSLVKLAINGLPVIPTMFCYKGNIIANADTIIEKLGLPLVVKDLHSQRGLGVSLIKEKADIVKIATDNPGKRYMFQKFINKKEEYRVLVLGETVGSYEVKTSTDPNEFRNNVSLGATEDFKEIEGMTEEVKYVSVKSAKVLRIEVAGVDVILDVDGVVWVLEVNRGPGFTYDSDESPEMKSVAKYFSDVLSKIKK